MNAVIPADWQWLAAVKYPDIIQPEKASLEHIIAVMVLAVDPPGEIEQQLVKYFLQKIQISMPRHIP